MGLGRENQKLIVKTAAGRGRGRGGGQDEGCCGGCWTRGHTNKEHGCGRANDAMKR